MEDGDCCTGNGWPWIVAIAIIIIILILLFIWIFTTPVSSPPPKPVPEIFEVTVVEKTPENPNYGIGSDLGFAINGEEGKVLKLTLGKTYRFRVNTPGHPFYLTTSSIGGVGAPDAIGYPREPSMSTSFPLTATADLPQPLYYQCALHEYMGAEIIIE